MKTLLCLSPPPSGPKNIMVGRVIFTIPFFSLVNQKVNAEIVRAVNDMTMLTLSTVIYFSVNVSINGLAPLVELQCKQAVAKLSYELSPPSLTGCK